jgi:hypothetical protein
MRQLIYRKIVTWFGVKEGERVPAYLRYSVGLILFPGRVITMFVMDHSAIKYNLEHDALTIDNYEMSISCLRTLIHSRNKWFRITKGDYRIGLLWFESKPGESNEEN